MMETSGRSDRPDFLQRGANAATIFGLMLTLFAGLVGWLIRQEVAGAAQDAALAELRSDLGRQERETVELRAQIQPLKEAVWEIRNDMKWVRETLQKMSVR